MYEFYIDIPIRVRCHSSPQGNDHYGIIMERGSKGRERKREICARRPSIVLQRGIVGRVPWCEDCTEPLPCRKGITSDQQLPEIWAKSKCMSYSTRHALPFPWWRILAHLGSFQRTCSTVLLHQLQSRLYCNAGMASAVTRKYLRHHGCLFSFSLFLLLLPFPSSQGQEAAIVLYSATASCPQQLSRASSFYADLCRANVALSRAHQKLIIVVASTLMDITPQDTAQYQQLGLWKCIKKM